MCSQFESINSITELAKYTGSNYHFLKTKQLKVNYQVTNYKHLKGYA